MLGIFSRRSAFSCHGSAWSSCFSPDSRRSASAGLARNEGFHARSGLRLRTMRHALAFILLAVLGNPSAWADYHPKFTRPPGDVSFQVVIGQYGESFDLFDDDVLDAQMNGPVEVLRIHPKWDPRQRQAVLADIFHPKESDYVPANFEKFELQELIAVPKGQPGYATLEQIRADKVAEAKKSGVAFEVHDLDLSDGWPPGTFEIWTKAPYRLVRFYAQTPKCFMIYSTAGTGLDSIRSSLSAYLYEAYRAADSRPDHKVAYGEIANLLIRGGILILLLWQRQWLLLCGLLLMLISIPGKGFLMLYFQYLLIPVLPILIGTQIYAGIRVRRGTAQPLTRRLATQQVLGITAFYLLLPGWLDDNSLDSRLYIAFNLAAVAGLILFLYATMNLWLLLGNTTLREQLSADSLRRKRTPILAAASIAIAFASGYLSRAAWVRWPETDSIASAGQSMECGGLSNPRKTLLDSLLFSAASRVDDVPKRRAMLDSYAQILEQTPGDLDAYLSRMEQSPELEFDNNASRELLSLARRYISGPLEPQQVKVTCRFFPLHTGGVGLLAERNLEFPPVPIDGNGSTTERLIVTETHICGRGCDRIASHMVYRTVDPQATRDVPVDGGLVWDMVPGPGWPAR